MLVLAIGLVVGFFGGIIAVLVFQGGEMAGRLTQHARDLSAAWTHANEFEAKSVGLQLRLENEREEHEAQSSAFYLKFVEAVDEYETRWAGLAAAYDQAVHKNDKVQQRRVDAWKALDSALRELHADPDPKCVTCGDSIKVDAQCFVCGLHDWSPESEQPRAQA